MKQHNTKVFSIRSLCITPSISYGFVLIEVMVSSSVFILLAALSMSFAARAYLQTCHILQVSSRCAQMQVTLDVFARDIMQAPACRSRWKMATEKQHVWTTVSGDVGFENTDHGIVRSQGLFDTKKRAWLRRTKSFFPRGLTYTLEPTKQDAEHIYLVSAAINSSDRLRVATTIALRSGICL